MKTRTVTPEMAKAAYFKLHDYIYCSGPIPYLSIPPREDDPDMILIDFIEQFMPEGQCHFCGNKLYDGQWSPVCHKPCCIGRPLPTSPSGEGDRG